MTNQQNCAMWLRMILGAKIHTIFKTGLAIFGKKSSLAFLEKTAIFSDKILQIVTIFHQKFTVHISVYFLNPSGCAVLLLHWLTKFVSCFCFFYTHLHPLFSIAYSKWVPALIDPNFNRTNALLQFGTKNPNYTQEMFTESLVVNSLGAALVALVIIMPILVLHPKFRNRPQRIITVTHDRYG